LIGLSQQHQFFYYTNPTDLRKGFDSLSGLVRNDGLNPSNGTVYIFVNKKRDKMKMLVWEPGGFMMYYKRLERGTFELLKYDEGQNKISITYQTLHFLIQGVQLEKIVRRKRYQVTQQ